MKRRDGRDAHEMRSIKTTFGITDFAPGNVLLELGKTKVLCSVTLQNSVPPFLKGSGSGWLTAEYALLPASTHIRTNRESSTMRRQGRSIEISRLISRALRSVIDLSAIGERTIMIDCDILQADGGTRTASINAAYTALIMAQDNLLRTNAITKTFIRESIGAIAVGVTAQGLLLVDPDFKEDSEGIADINIIMTYQGKLVELQGGAEKKPLPWSLIIQAGDLAQKAIATIEEKISISNRIIHSAKADKIPLFSLKNRQPQSPI